MPCRDRPPAPEARLSPLEPWIQGTPQGLLVTNQEFLTHLKGERGSGGGDDLENQATLSGDLPDGLEDQGEGGFRQFGAVDAESQRLF